MTVLPEGFTDQTFQKVLAELATVVGDDWVFSSEDDLYTYRDVYSPLWDEEDERLASAAVAPQTVEEIQAIVKIANEYKLPVYPISTGKNLGYGGAAPNLTGSVVIDLKRMNKIIEIDADRCFVLVEPGVSYFDLYNEIEERGLDLMIDCPEPGWGSLVGNSLERGVGYTHSGYRDHWAAHCGMEVVLPNGRLMRTGMGALPGAGSWQDNRYGFGPYVDGLFSQGNFGIVTKMGFHLMPKPKQLRVGLVSAPKYEDITGLVSTLNRLEASGIADGLPQFFSPVFGGMGVPPNADIQRVFGREGGVDPAEIDALAAGRPCWTLRVLFYGPDAVTRAKWEFAKEEFAQSVPGATFEDAASYDIPMSEAELEALSPMELDKERQVNFGVPNLSIFMLGARSPAFPAPSDGHVWFAPVIPRTGEDVMKAQNILVRALAEMGVYTGANVPVPMCQYPRSFLLLIPFFLSHSDPDLNKRAVDSVMKLIDICAENGWSEYRAAPAFHDKIASVYNFNDHALLDFVGDLKDAADPNGILSAGRYGVWPAHLREEAKK